ncbi:MAG TPA: hypothetical protein VMH00_12140 [Candidatus Limnocylindrales bacterium]|nr:hypothetical protein [Candidatus Limnocylindrales bacterium]
MRNHVAAFIVCGVLGVLFTAPGSLSPRSALLGYPGDNYQHAWFLWHFAKALTHGENPFFTNLLFYPTKVNLAWSTTDPLAGALVLPVSLFGGPVLAYNVSLISQLVLAAFFGRLLCLRICGNELAALAGGLVFGFSPFLTAHALGHLGLVTAFPIPLFVLMLHEILIEEKTGWGYGVGLGAALLLTALAHYDYTVLCVFFACFMVGIEVVLRGPEALKRTWKPISLGAATFFVGFLPILKLLVASRSVLPATRGLEHVQQFSADALGFLVPSWDHLLLGHFARGWDPKIFAAGFEGTVYVGPVVLLLAIVGAVKGRAVNSTWPIRALILSVVFYLFSLGPRVRLLGDNLGIPGPAALFYRFRLAQFISAPARFQVLVALCVSILCSLGLAFLIRDAKPSWRRHGIFLALITLILCDYLTIPFPQSSIIDPALPAGATQAARSCALPADVAGGSVITFPLLKAPYCMKSMWMQVSDGGRYALVDGYLSYAPDQTWRTLWDTPILRSLLSLQGTVQSAPDEGLDRETVQGVIDSLKVRAFVVFDSPQHDAAVRYLQAVLNTGGDRAGSCTIFRTQSHEEQDGAKHALSSRETPFGVNVYSSRDPAATFFRGLSAPGIDVR